MTMHPKHDEDFYGWAMAEANLLRQRRLGDLDFDNLIEELESMGASERRALVSRMAQLIFHLLKWQFQPDFRGRSWRASIKEQRKKTKGILKDNPSFKNEITNFISDAYEDAFLLIEKETPLDLKLFPAECPYSFEQIMNNEFYPE
jgi:hypothetical protein